VFYWSISLVITILFLIISLSLSFYQHHPSSSRHLEEDTLLSAEYLLILTGLCWSITVVTSVYLILDINLIDSVLSSDHTFFILALATGSVTFSLLFSTYEPDSQQISIMNYAKFISFMLFVHGLLILAQFGSRFATLPIVKPGVSHILFTIIGMPLLIVFFGSLFSIMFIHINMAVKMIRYLFSSGDSNKYLGIGLNQRRHKKKIKVKKNIQNNEVANTKDGSVYRNMKEVEVNEYGELVFDTKEND